MSAAAKAMTMPRYGSPAQLATYSGLSVKTVRRLVEAGEIGGHKVGRRLLIPFEDIDRRIRRPCSKETPIMATVTTPVPTGTVDIATGRLLPLTEEERLARLEALRVALDEMDHITDETDTDEVWREVMRGIDESRPHRPLFEGAY